MAPHAAAPAAAPVGRTCCSARRMKRSSSAVHSRGSHIAGPVAEKHSPEGEAGSPSTFTTVYKVFGGFRSKMGTAEYAVKHAIANGATGEYLSSTFANRKDDEASKTAPGRAALFSQASVDAACLPTLRH